MEIFLPFSAKCRSKSPKSFFSPWYQGWILQNCTSASSNDRAAVVLQGRQHAHLVYWSQTRNTLTIVPESPLFIVMAREEKEAERLLSNSSMSHPPQMRLSPKAWNSSSALIQYLLLLTCKMVPHFLLLSLLKICFSKCATDSNYSIQF